MTIRRIGGNDDDDPLSGLANLFDLGIVFSIGLMLTATGNLILQQPQAESSQNNVQIDPDEALKKLDRYRVSEEELAGRGDRLGIAYRLENGEVVYVPERKAASETPQATPESQ